MVSWLDQAITCLKEQADLILVSVVDVRGSAPRNAATKMLVSADEQWLTIGGGNLEWQATAKAREHLKQISDSDLVLGFDNAHGHYKTNFWFDVFQLGPSLGQCCGGVVGVLFEHLNQSDLPFLEYLQQSILAGVVIRSDLQPAADAEIASLGLTINPSRQVYKTTFNPVSNTELQAAYDDFYKHLTSAQKASGPHDLCLFKRTAAGFSCTEYLQPEKLNIYIFGAGHVGKALVNVLSTLPCKVTWVDSRADQFPDSVASNVSIEETDIPEAVIDDARPGSCFVILTYDHALDQRLCEHLMKRNDALYFGLIGSRTKRQKFEHRFKAKGIEKSRYEKMVCPIGLPEIKGKQPAIIALAVAAELMCLREEGHTYGK